MRRPPGLWILLSAGVLWLSLQDVYGIRATSLIFGKSSTTTTTTEVPGEAEAASEATVASTEATPESNVTKPPLTGNPQLDYIYDPNLPKELNGHNLSDYPFYERVPDEEIEFKCDGLHDGFYASIPHRCQVYHHCLFGTRYDFLCANYTAFDQKTFICHFASEVDCDNSKKYWHRNDALYQAASTTTVKPLVIQTTPADAYPLTLTPGGGAVPRRPGGRRRLHPQRRRPQYDYYEDDYYDDDYYERPRSERRRKRPRPRPRPKYDEYDDEYDEDRYERRGSGRRDEDRKRPDRGDQFERRPNNRRKNKDRGEYDYDEEDVREDDNVKVSRRDNDKRKTPVEDSDKRPSERPAEKRRPYGENKKRKTADEDSDESRLRERGQDKRRQSNRDSDYDRKPARKSQRRPYSDDDEPQNDDSRAYDRPRKSEERRNKPQTTEASRAIIKPVSGTIYDRPRVAPRIKLPVPKNEADKYAYKPIATQPLSSDAADDDEYYDDYEEVPKPKSNRKPVESSERPSKSTTSSREEEAKESRKQFSANFRSRGQSSKQPIEEEAYESYERPQRQSTKRPKFVANRQTSSSRKRPVVEEYYEDYEEEEGRALKNTKHRNEVKESSTSTTTTSTTTSTSTTTTTTTEKPEYRIEPHVKIVRRPFLPSRGGNPYSARGLQPVGNKAVDKPTTEEDYDTASYDSEIQDEKESDQKITTKYVFKNAPYTPKDDIKNDYKLNDDIDETVPERKPVFKPSPVILKVPVRQKFVAVQDDYTAPNRDAEIRQTYKPKEYSGPRTTQKPKVPEKNPLDLNEYDVTLNDALNPTLPNLPVRAFPTGFSAATDYTFSSFQRPRYVLDPVLSPASSDYSYQTNKPARLTRYEGQSSNGQFTNSNADYKGQYSTISGQSYRPRQTHAFYTSY